MVASLGIALREGIEAALIVGIVLMYLSKTGRSSLRGYVFAAVGTAIAASVALAVVFESIGIDVENPYFEGVLLGVTGLLVVTMVLWMRRAVTGLRTGVETRLESITGAKTGSAAVLGLFGFVFFMILREGAELVLFLKAATLGSEASLSNLVGALVGLLLAVLFAVLFVRGSVRVDIRRFFRYTSWALLALGAKLLLGSLHEFGELGVLPFANGFFEEAGELTGGLAGDILMGVIIAVPVVLLLWDTAVSWRQSRSGVTRAPAGPKAEAARERN